MWNGKQTARGRRQQSLRNEAHCQETKELGSLSVKKAAIFAGWTFEESLIVTERRWLGKKQNEWG